MSQVRANQLCQWLAFPLLCVLLGTPGLRAQEADGGAPAAAAAKFRGRLPAYFKQVISADQKDEIYKIQEDYAKQIQALQNQILALVDKRDEEVRAVLTEEQVKEVEALIAAAKARRRQAQGDEEGEEQEEEQEASSPADPPRRGRTRR